MWSWYNQSHEPLNKQKRQKVLQLAVIEEQSREMRPERRSEKFEM